MADLTPNAATASAARKGLRLYEDGKGGDGLVAATISDARKMSARSALSERKVRRMPAWFARHEVDQKPGWDTPGEETPGYVAWLLWGGDAGRRWATAKVKELDKEADVGRSNPAAHDSRTFDEDEYVRAKDDPMDDDEEKEEDEEEVSEEEPSEDVPSEDPVEDGPPSEDVPPGEDSEPSEEEPSEEDEKEDEEEDEEEKGARSVERHTSRDAVVEWRESGAGSNYRTLTGYASVFDTPSEDLGGFVEVIAPGAFRSALEAGADVRLLYNHDPDSVMARTTNGSLELTEDQRGLKIWARVDMNDPDVARVVGKVRSGLVDQMSFAFSIDEGGDEWSVLDGYPMRTVREVSGLYDVSAVTYPAYPRGTKVEVMERAIREGRIAQNAAPVDGLDPENPADVVSSRQAGEALKRLQAKARSRTAVIHFNLSR
jgi:HK97 family phage prohead protease